MNEIQQKPKLHVLVANDEDIQLQIQSDLFKMFDFQVVKVVNGLEAYKSVKERLEKVIQGLSLEPMFNLIVLDINMPMLNGL